MKRFSILLRVILLSTVLLIVLIGSVIYLSRQISHHKSTMFSQVELLSVVSEAQSASQAFGDVKYWLSDLAVSMLMHSERRSNSAREELFARLDQLEPHNPNAVAHIRKQVDLLMAKALLAVDAYAKYERVLGNSLMSASRVHIREAEKGISELVRHLRVKAFRNRDMALEESARTQRLTIFVVLLASLFGMTLTFFVGRSIHRTLGERDRLALANETSQKALIERESRLDAILTTVADAIITIDTKGRIMTFNPAATRIFGYQVNEVIGQSVGMLMSPEDSARHNGYIEHFMRHGHGGGPMRSNREILGRNKFGREFPIHISLSQMEVGGKVMFAGILRDVTELKRHEGELLSAKDAAVLANRSKTEFLANMSHELRTPLNAIIGFSEMMKMEALGPIQPPEYREYVRDIRSSGTHLLDVINDILDMSKIEIGEATVADSEVSIAAVMSSCLRMVDERAKRGDVQLLAEGLDHLPLLLADARMLKQILLNLLSNAVKFTECQGSVRIFGGIDGDKQLFITVADTGIGMTNEGLAKAFAPFQQVDNSLQRKFEGTGLGLPLVKSMMELHDGTASLESTLGVGTIATIRFPATRVARDLTAPNLLTDQDRARAS
ncbi:MAG: PAS domain S-box protein [Alphaproteobacteria bacterium]|nr:PAS domain S-box protein [Alphaproteobacteria bacterium]